MKIAIAAPAGNVGRRLVEVLLERGDHDLLLLARHPGKMQDAAGSGARILQGSLEDEAFLSRATRGVDALFWVTPSDPRSEDLRGLQDRLGGSAAGAIRANRIPRVVNLSSFGAHLGSGTGPVNGLHDVERLLNRTGTHVTHLRAAYFFENYLWQIGAIRSAGKVFLPVSGQACTPMVAAEDVARAAAERLTDPDWSGQSVRGIHGPTDLTFDEAAAGLSEALGRSVVHVKVDRGQAREAMLGSGLREDVAELMLELYSALDAGTLAPAEARTEETTTPTTLIQFAREILAPAIAEGSSVPEGLEAGVGSGVGAQGDRPEGSR